jgi:hypothetical protein
MARDPIDRLRVEMEELFNDLWQVPRFARRPGGFRPQIDCYRTERPAAFHVIVELAGVDPAKIQVFADEGTLVVSGERRRPRCEGRVYQQMEIDYGRFTRQSPSDGHRHRGFEGDLPARRPTIALPLAKKPASAERIEIPVSIRSKR